MENLNLEAYSCPNCARVYTEKTLASFKAHVAKCGSVNFKCDACGNIFLSLDALKLHLKIFHTHCPTFPCEKCGKKFRTKFQRQEHEQVHLDSASRKRLACEYCGKTFVWKPSLRRHLHDHISSEIEAYKCLCGKTFSKYSIFYIHKKNCLTVVDKKKREVEGEETAVSGETDAAQANHKCQFCGVGFSDRQKLSDHVDTCDPFMDSSEKLLTKTKMGNMLSKYKPDRKKAIKARTDKDFRKMANKSEENAVAGPSTESETKQSENDTKVTNRQYRDVTKVTNKQSEDGGTVTNIQCRDDKKVKNEQSRDDTKVTNKQSEDGGKVTNMQSEDYKKMTIKVEREKGENDEITIIVKLENDPDDNEYGKVNQESDLTKESNNMADPAFENDCSEYGRSKRKRKIKQFSDYETDFSSPKQKRGNRSKAVDVEPDVPLRKSWTTSSYENEDACMFENSRKNKSKVSEKSRKSRKSIAFNKENDSSGESKSTVKIEAESSDDDSMPLTDSGGNEKGCRSLSSDDQSLVYVCTTKNCFSSCADERPLVNHKKKVHNEKLEYICSECEKAFVFYHSYKCHISKEHRTRNFVDLRYKNVDLRCSNDLSKTCIVPVCTNCGCKVFSGDKDSHVHISENAVLPKFFCPYCETCETAFKKFQKHLKELHPQETHSVSSSHKQEGTRSKPGISVEDTKTSCVICDEKFDENDKLLAHISKEHACLPYCCGVCKQLYGRLASLKKHMLAHNNPPLVCTVCSKPFLDQSLLEAHERSHVVRNNGESGVAVKSGQKKSMKVKRKSALKETIKDTYVTDGLATNAKSKKGFASNDGDTRDEVRADAQPVNDDTEVKYCTEGSTESTDSRTESMDRSKMSKVISDLTDGECKQETDESCNETDDDINAQDVDLPMTEVSEPTKAGKGKRCPPIPSLAYVCVSDDCSKHFLTLKQMKAHKKEVHKEKFEYLCKACMKLFNVRSFYISHLRMKHLGSLNFVDLAFKNAELKYSDNLSKNYRIPICVKCGSVVLDDDSDGHICDILVQMQFYCPYCKLCETTFTKIQDHMKKSHPQEAHRVDICSKPQSWRSETLDKSLLALDETSTECITCNEKFKSNSELLAHISEKHASKPYCCGVCRLPFGRKLALMKHLEMHSKTTYRCEICSRTFSMRHYLEDHKRVHVEERPFHCDICDKRYFTEKSVKCHMKIKHPEAFRERYKDSKAVQELACKLALKKKLGIRISIENTDPELESKKKKKPSRIRTEKTEDETVPERAGKVMVVDAENKDTTTGGSMPKAPSLAYVCTSNNCNEYFTVKNKLVVHKKIVHKEKLEYLCVECLRTFAAHNIYKTHLRMKHLGSLNFINLAFRNVDLKYIDDLSKNYQIRVCVKCASDVLDDDLDTHTCSVTVQMEFFCPYCKSCEPTFTKIQDHMKESHPQKAHHVTLGSRFQSLRNETLDKTLLSLVETSTKCITCNEKFESNKELLAHISKKHASRPYCCGLCRLSYGRRPALLRHMLVHNNTDYVCEICSKTFYDQKSLQSHKNMHAGDRPFQCDVCGNRYAMESSIRKHMQRTHPETFKEKYKDSKSLKQFDMESDGCVCPVCGKTFDGPKHLNRHMIFHKKEAILQCTDCSRHFNNSRQLKLHNLRHVSCKLALKKNEMCSQLVKVNNLGEMRKALMELKIVDDTHPSKKFYQCSVCLKRFRGTKSLYLHIQTMHVEDRVKSFICNICGRGFTRRKMLEAHQRVHTSARPYRCRLCQKSYRQVAHVREHLRAHGKSLFSCRFCPRSFKTLSILSTHIKSHCNIFPFRCPVESCNETFKNIHQLCEHGASCFAANDPDSSFRCKLCNQTFAQSGDVILHMYMHENEGLFPCEVCGVQLNSFKNLYFHKDKNGHFLESELQAQKQDPRWNNNYTSKKTVEEVDWQYGVEDLMNQYDIIKESSLEPSESDTMEKIQESGVVEETYGNEAEELILIAEQLTNMATGTEQYAEVVIQDSVETVQQLNNFASENLGFPAIVMKTAETYEAGVEADTDLFERKAQNLDGTFVDIPVCSEQQEIRSEMIYCKEESSEQSMQSNQFVNRQTNDTSQLQVLESEINDGTKCISNKSGNATQPVQVFSNTEALLIKQTESNKELNEDCHVDVIKEENVDINEILDNLSFSIPGIGDHVKVVDTQGNEVTVCVVNERGEQEQVTDGQEILRSVLQTGRYKIQCTFKQVETEEVATEDETTLMINTNGTNIDGAGYSNKVKVTDIFVVTEKDEHEPVVTIENKEKKPSVVRKVKKEVQRKDGNTRKIKGELVKNFFNEEDDHDKADGFNYKVRLNYYQEKDELKYPHVCQVCGARFKSVKDKNHHRKTHLSNEQRKHRCTVCGAGFNIPNSLRIHMRTHTGEKPFSCETCGKKFRQLGHLQVHMRGHLQYNPFKCTICDKRFRVNSNLTRHMKQHDPENVDIKNFPCDYCDAIFRSNRAMKRHQLASHLNKKSQRALLKMCNSLDDGNDEIKRSLFNTKKIAKEMSEDVHHICDVCGLTFQTARAAKLHRLRHDTGSDFPCNQCDMAFASEPLLKEHVTKCHPEEFPCEVCGQQFKQKTGVQKHLLRVHKKGANKYKCRQCGEAFSLMHLFLEHVSGTCMKNDVEKMLVDSIIS